MEFSSPQPVDLIACRLPIDREFALLSALPAALFRARSEPDFAAVCRAITTQNEGVVILELAALTSAEWREFQRLFAPLRRAWIVVASVRELQVKAVTDLYELGVDIVAGPDEPAIVTAHQVSRAHEARAVQREYDRLLAAVQAAPCGISIADVTQPDTPLVFVNDTFETITGYPREESLGRNCRFLQRDLHGQASLKVVRQALAKGSTAHVKLNNRRKDGTVFINELHLAPFRDALGRVTHFVGLQQDVTAREATLQRLIESEERYHTMADALPIKAWQLDPELRTEFLNEAWRSFTPIMGGAKAPDLLKWIDPADLETTRATLLRAVHTGRPVDFEARLVSPTGETRWHHFKVVPRAGEDGRIVGLIGSAVDVSASKANDERTARRLRQLSLQTLLMRRLLGDPSAPIDRLAQALEIMAEMTGASELALTPLAQGVETVLAPRGHWATGSPAALPSLLGGHRLTEVLPFSAAKMLIATGAMRIERGESKRFTAAGIASMLVFPVRREQSVVGCLFVTRGRAEAGWEEACAETLHTLSNLLHFAC